jgi:aminoglycoside 3-N-acetyltransferase
VRRTPIARPGIIGQAAALGVRRGSVLVVHTSFSKVGPVEGGPEGLILALRDTLGPEGTLVMPSMSDDDDHPFDPRTTPSAGMGVLADTFWRLPGVLRSDSPHAFAAAGPHAEAITARHPLDVPHGLDSPVGRVYELNGDVLLLGVGHDANTTIHLAENMAGVRYLRPKHVTTLVNGAVTRYHYSEVDHCCQQFALMDRWLDALGCQRHGSIGHGQARLARSRDIVDAALAHLRQDETVFLHPPGIDQECDDARAQLLVARRA